MNSDDASKGRAKRPTWIGGYVRHGKLGPTFVIERWIGGEHFHVSTRCRTERAAIKQLERFEMDPSGYRPLAVTMERVVMTTALITEYRDWMMKRKQNPTSKDWAHSQASMLSYWMVDLGGRDLRHLNLFKDLKAALARPERATCQTHRIEAIKAFFSWLREERGLVKREQDATLDLHVPQSEPAQNRKDRAVPMELVAAVLPFLGEEARDVLILLSGTGWHVQEVRRFAKSGQIFREVRGCLAVIVTRHKIRRPHATRLLHEVHVKAAERILKRGAIPGKEKLAKEMQDACDVAGVAQFRMGVMRHTVASEAMLSGESLKDVSEFLGHTNVKTTGRYVVQHAAVKAVKTFTPEDVN